MAARPIAGRIALDVSAVPDRPVGAGVYTVELARGLARRDLDLVLVCRRNDAARWSDWAPSATVVPEAPNARASRLAWEQYGAPRIADRVGAALWHGPHYTLPLRLDLPRVVTVHDLTFFDHPEWHERSKVVYFQRMIRAASRGAAAIVCVSQATADRLAAVVTPIAESTVIPHGVDHGRFQPEPAPDDLVRLAAHGIRRPYVGFVSTIEPRKNAPGLIRSFARLAHEYADLQLVIGGSPGWGIDEVRRAIEASGCATRIARPGRIDDDALAAFYRHAAVVAYPSFEEGFGLPILEAMACGAPVVTSRGSALEEVAGDGALCVDSGDDVALAAAIGAALDPRTAARLHAAGPLRARGFDWERCVDAHVTLYQRVAA